MPFKKDTATGTGRGGDADNRFTAQVIQDSLAESQGGGDLPACLDAKNPQHLQGTGQASLNSNHTSQGKMGGSCMDGRVLCDRGDPEWQRKALPSAKA